MANIKIYIIVIRDSFFYFVFEGNFQVGSLQGLIFGGAILRYQFGGGGRVCLEGLIYGGAYFRNFTTMFPKSILNVVIFV